MISRISLVTPSFNQARFLGECLRSVAEQTPPALEHLVFDPGSNDGSREIAAAAPGVALVAEPDQGQADAVGRGFRQMRGDVFGWLNSDDVYADPGVFAAVLDRFNEPDRPDIVYGRALYVDEDGEVLKPVFIHEDPSTFDWALLQGVGISQPATFIHRRVVERIGVPDTKLQYCMDYEYWLRAHLAGLRFAFLPLVLAHSRYYPTNKTAGKRGESFAEVCGMLKEKLGFTPAPWLRRWAEHKVFGFDGIFERADTPGSTEPRVRAELKRLLEAYNTDYDALHTLNQGAANPAYDQTLKTMRSLGVSLDRPCWPVPNDTKSVRGGVLYTVGERRWAFDRRWRDRQLAKTRQMLPILRAKRRGDVCVIVGNGPSLNHTDLSLLRGTDVFVSNYAFLNETLMRSATYLAVVNYLVAEQGSYHFNNIDEIYKFFPYWLSYCLNEDSKTLFINSVGHPVFSTDITENASWRSTVSFFQMQIAYALGYRKVVLIGFDHNYPHQDSRIEGEIIKDDNDDRNHFDPRYFKGKYWQAADVDNMESMYRLAKEAYEADGREIVNCTVGGRLEVFRRSTLEAELAGPTTLPRTLIIDTTPLGGRSATGQLKQTLFENWPRDHILQMQVDSRDKISLHRVSNGPLLKGSRASDLIDACERFAPDIIYYRPVAEHVALHRLACEVVERLPTPLVIHIVDDWPERLARTDPQLHQKLDASLRGLLDRAVARLSISDAMSTAFAQRYGGEWTSVANGVDPDVWTRLGTCPPGARDRPFTLRYCGALAEDIQFQSVVEVAQAVDALQPTCAVRFEIHTMPWWKRKAASRMGGLNGISLDDGELSGEAYREWLVGADALLIAYNFDEHTTSYVRYSMANKMPECLASGVPVLAYGPAGLATIDHLARSGCAKLVTQQDAGALQSAIRELATDAELRKEMGSAGRAFALSHHNAGEIRSRFERVMREAAHEESRDLMGPYSRAHHAHLDETEVVTNLLAKRARVSVMVDVGAHFGGSAARFADQGWRVLCFEPDPDNRERLVRKLGHNPRVTIDARAVADQKASGRPLFASPESSGISGLLSFRPSHAERERVDVTTIADALDEHGIDRITFLKVDVEGLDFAVLKGVPWDRVRPDVVMCEFDEAKTVPLGHTFREMADFLVERGYSVYVSEWHPVLRYGGPHDWRGLKRYPCALSADDAWGNLLAFATDPGWERVNQALSKSLRTKASIQQRKVLAGLRPRLLRLRERVARVPGARRAYHAGRRLAAFFVGRWPPVIAALAVILQTAALAGAPFAWALGAMAAGLFLVLIAHAGMFGREAEVKAAAAQRAADKAAGTARTEARRLGELEAEVEEARAQTSAALERHGQQLGDLAATREDTAKIRAVIERSDLANAAAFRPFNRGLTDAHLERLRTLWLPALGLEPEPRTLAYLAHQVCLVEDRCVGRLATSVEDMLVRVLAARALAGPRLAVLEIGTLFGVGLAALHETCFSRFDRILLVAVDPFEGYYDRQADDIVTGAPVSRTVFEGNMRRCGVCPDDLVIIPHLSTESEALAQAGRHRYNLLIIDGDHSYAGVKADFDRYRPLVEPGGLVVFDDYGAPEWPEVKAFVDDEVRPRADLALVGADWRTAVFRVGPA